MKSAFKEIKPKTMYGKAALACFIYFIAEIIGFAGYGQLYMKGQKLPVEMTAFNSLAQAE